MPVRVRDSQGLFWALGCIWLIYRPIKMPHIKGESYANLNSSYTYVYSDYLPVEFFCNGVISACLTFINVMCIFITAIIVLKVIKVSARRNNSRSHTIANRGRNLFRVRVLTSPTRNTRAVTEANCSRRTVK